MLFGILDIIDIIACHQGGKSFAEKISLSVSLYSIVPSQLIMEIILPSFSVSSINVIEGSALVFSICERLPDVYKDNARSANIVAIYIFIIIFIFYIYIYINFYISQNNYPSP